MFGENKEFQEEVVLLSNAYSNRIDNLIDSFDKENVISRRQSKNATNPRLSDTGGNRVASHFKIKERATKKYGVTGHSKKRERMEDVNGDMSEVSFLN